MGSSASSSRGRFASSPGDRHALHLSARQFRRTVAGARGQADVLEQLARALAALGTADARLRLRQLDVFPCGEHWQEEEPLEHEADLTEPQPAALGVGQRPDLAVFEMYASSRWHVDDAEHVQQRRLSAAGRSDDADVLAARDAQRDIAQRRHGTRRHWEHLRHVARFDDRAAHEITSRRSVAAIGSVDTMRIGYSAAAIDAVPRSAR